MPSRPAPLNRLEVLAALRISNWEAVHSTVHATLTTGAFQTGFALWLGASNLAMGIAGAIPTIAALAQLAAAYVVEKRGERRLFTAWFSLASRIAWVPILLIPVVAPEPARLPLFLLLLLVSSILINVPAPAFTSWMADLVPPDHRGRYFGRRNMLAGLTATVVSLPAAWFLDLATKKHLFSNTVAFGTLFGIASVFGVLSFVCLLRQAEPPMRRTEGGAPRGLRALIGFYRQPFRDAGYRRLLEFSGLFSLGQFIAAPFYTVYALRVLNLDYVWLQVFGAISSLAALISMPVWGRLSDKFGAKPLLAIAVAGTATLPLGWVVTSCERPVLTLVMLIINHLLGGLFWAGVGLVSFNLLIASTPSEGKSVYVGAMAAVTGLIGGLAPVLGGVVVSALENVHLAVAGWNIGPYRTLFVINAIIRFLTLAFLRRVPGEEAASPREVIAQIGAAPVGAWRHMRRLQQAPTHHERREAAEALADARSAVASAELIAALDDASLAVRQKAALALGEARGRGALEALLTKVEERAAGIVLECARALGQLGDPRAEPALTHLLLRGDRAERAEAARALGLLRLPHTADALLQALGAETDTGSIEACLTALGSIGARGLTSHVRGYVTHHDGAVRRAAIRAIGASSDPEAGEILASALQAETDAATIAQLLDSIGAIGDPGALAAVLRTLEQAESELLRKQAAYTASLLAGCETLLYPLLSADGFARDETVARLLREMAAISRRRRGAAFVQARRRRLAEKALEHYMACELDEAVEITARLSDANASESLGLIVEWARRLSSTTGLHPEGFLLLLTAAASLREEADTAPE